MKKKIGDRIFFEYYDGTIGTAIIRKIEDKEYKKTDRNGEEKVVHYQMYHTGNHTIIEDYNCLSEKNPRVIEFCNNKDFYKGDLKKEIEEWLTTKGCHKGDMSVAEVLYEVYLEYQ